MVAYIIVFNSRPKLGVPLARKKQLLCTFKCLEDYPTLKLYYDVAFDYLHRQWNKTCLILYFSDPIFVSFYVSIT